MRLQDDIDFTTLNWVKGELDETLKQARLALEAYVEDPDDASQMRFCATYLHQVQGTLRMVELYGAAMVTEEMEQLATALQNRQVSALDEAYAVLMRGIVQLPDYLERLQGGHKDIPIVLLPLLNDLRAARGEKGLPESALFAPDLSLPMPASAAGPIAPLPELELRQLAGVARSQFQLALLRWFKGQDADANLVRMIEVCDRLVGVVSQEEGRRLFWVAGSVLFGVRSGEIEASQQLKQTVGRVEREIKHLADAGDTGFRVDPPRELTRNLLYFIAHGRANSDRLAEVRDAFRLERFVPTQDELAEAVKGISGHNRALLDTVAGAIREDLLRVKDALDLYLRKADAQPSELAGQVDVLDRVGDTLGMLGLGVPRRVVMEQRDIVALVSQGQRPADESTLLDIAGALLYVDATLDDQVEQLGSANASQPAADTLPRAEARKVLEAVIKEAQSNFAQAKQCFVAFVESNWDHAQLQDVPRLLEEVAGAMRILDLPQAAELLHGVARFTAVELVQHRRVPNGQQMDTLADALASLEYFIEAVRDQRSDRGKILDVARERLVALGYWPVPDHALASVESEIPAAPAVRAAPATIEAEPMPATEPVDVAPAVEDSLVLDADVPPAREEHALDSLGAVEVAPGSGLEDLIVGETAAEPLAPPREEHELGGFKPAETEATRPPLAEPAAPPVIGAELVGFQVGAEDIDEEIREVFVEEVQEEIDNLRALLPAWQAKPDDMEALKPIRRVFHTLKGSGRLVGALVLGEFAWKIENMLNRVLDNSIPPRPQVLALIAEARDVLPKLLAALRGEVGQFADLEGLQATAEALASGQVVDYQPPRAAAPPPASAVPAPSAPEAPASAIEEEEKIELSAEDSAAIEALLSTAGAVEAKPEAEAAESEQTAIPSMDLPAESPTQAPALPEVSDASDTAAADADADADASSGGADQSAAEFLEHGTEATTEADSADAAALEAQPEGEVGAEPVADAFAAEAEESVELSGFELVDLDAPDAGSDASAISQPAEVEADLPEFDLSTLELETIELDETPALSSAVESGLGLAAESVEEALPEPVHIDPDLFEILKAEVAGHLDTVEAYLQRSAGTPLPVHEPLLRAVHTINGAFAMTEVEVGTELAWPLEGYIKRLLAQAAAPSMVGFELIEEATQALRALMIELDQPLPRPQPHERLAARIASLRDALPEPTHPVLPTEPDDERFESARQPAVSADSFALGDTAPQDSTATETAAQSVAPAVIEPAGEPAEIESIDLQDALEVNASGELSFDSVLEHGEPFDPNAQAQSADLEIIETEGASTSPFWTDTGASPTTPEVESGLTLDELGEAEAADAWLAAFEAEVAGEPKQPHATPAETVEAAPQHEEVAAASDDALLIASLLSEETPADAPVTESPETQAPAFAAPVVEAELDGETLSLEEYALAEQADDSTHASELDALEQSLELEAIDLGAYALDDSQAVTAPSGSTFDEQGFEAEGYPQAEIEEQAQPDVVETESVEARSDVDAELVLGVADLELSTDEADASAPAIADLATDATANALSESLAEDSDALEAQEIEAALTEIEPAELAAPATIEVAAFEVAEPEAAEALSLEAPGVEPVQTEPQEASEPSLVSAQPESAFVAAEDGEDVIERAALAPEPELTLEPEAAAPAETPALAGKLDIATDEDPDGPLDLTDVDADLLDVFLEEGVDILDHSDGLMVKLREAPQDRELVVGLQRDLHTLKGGARMAGLTPIGDLSHATESLLEAVALGGRDLGTVGVEVLERAFDRLHALVSRVGERKAIASPANLLAAVEALLRGEALPTVSAQPVSAAAAVETALSTEAAPAAKAPPPIRFIPTETALDEEETVSRAPQEQIRIRADLLDRLVNYAGEVAIYRARLEQQLGAFRGNLGELDQTTTRLREQLRKLEIETEAQILSRYQRHQDEGDADFDPLELDRFSTLQQLSRALSESAADIVNLQNTLEDLTRQYETLLLQQSRVSSDLQEGLMRTRMVPFDSLVPRLRRILRQTAGELGKQAQLKVEGAQGEMDRNVLDRMTAPLEHMLRNAVAHGMETPDERRAAGKPAEGIIRIAVAREASEVLIRVSDDGRGLDRDAIRRKAIERGLMKPDAQLGDRDLYGFILESGFSTAQTVSKIAGRGVGMDVVYSEIRQLGGSLHIESERGRGTEFVIRLPFTLAVTQAVFVKQGDTSFAVPITSVQGVSRIDRSELDKQLATGAPVFNYAGEEYAIHDLGLLLGQPAAKAADSLQVPLLLARSGDQRAAICVDNVLGSREIVVKPTGPQVSSIPGIFGATIMGDGRVVVILDVAPLVRRAAAIEHVETPDAAADQRVVPLVMVVDDSITMRKVTGRVLERHNFEVLTAKDGVDAIEKLAERVPDVMLLDIEMPRMDGYELATHMRNDARLKSVPIIMITSRTGDKHRQRAFEIGVDRYLGKPYQEADLMRNVQEILQARRERSR
jgi:chemosensory pili system protein ChpA (sensor histidine kinase/response regulator)